MIIKLISKNGIMTGEIQNAIDKVHDDGGGIVLFEKGKFVTGTLYLRSNVHIQLDDLAVIEASTNIEDYTLDTLRQMYRNETHMDRCLFFAKDCENIRISGGTIDGMGQCFNDSRPMMFRYYRSKNIRISDIYLKRPASWTNAFISCEDIWVSGIEIFSRANGNGDGLDFDACKNVFVSNSKFNCSDDCICVQNSTIDKAASDIFVSNCRFVSKWAGVRIGLLSTYTIENIFISNCSFENIDCSGLKIQSSEGAILRNVICSNLTMKNVRRPFFITLNHFRENVLFENDEIKNGSELYNITIKDVIAYGREDNDLPNCMIIDSEKGHKINNVLLENIFYEVYGEEDACIKEVPYLKDTRAEAFKYESNLPAYGLYARNVKDLSLKNVVVKTKNKDSRPMFAKE